MKIWMQKIGGAGRVGCSSTMFNPVLLCKRALCKHLSLFFPPRPPKVKRKIHQSGPWEKRRSWNLPRPTAESFCERCHDWHVIHDQRWRGTWQITMDLIRFDRFRSHGVGWKAAHNAIARLFDPRHQWRMAPAAFLSLSWRMVHHFCTDYCDINRILSYVFTFINNRSFRSRL